MDTGWSSSVRELKWIRFCALSLWQWSDLETSDLDCNNVLIRAHAWIYNITTLYLLGLYWCILHFFLNTPIPLPDHPESITWTSCEVINLLVLEICQPCLVFGTDVGFRHAQRWRPQRRTIMTTTANWVANGASLEDCHSNIFSLVQYQ